MGKLNKIIKLLTEKDTKISYAQYGEDIIMQGAFDTLKIKKPKYIEIGTHHPTLINNTYLFYILGSQGIYIEPSPELFKKIKNKRKRDICLNIGISDIEGKNLPYYVMTAQTLNTFSKTFFLFCSIVSMHIILGLYMEKSIARIILSSIPSVSMERMSEN